VTLKGVSLQLECRRSFDGKVEELIAVGFKRFILFADATSRDFGGAWSQWW